MNGLDETLLGFVPILIDAMGTVLTDYKVLLESARREIDSMKVNQHARAVSRIGFVAQDMKDFQYEVFNAIQNRAGENNNNNAECLLEAERRLESSAVEGGDVIVYAARQWSSLNEYIADAIVFLTVDEIDVMISLFEFELLNLFARFNSVTDMFDLLLTYQTGLQVFFLLFEYFVYQIYVDLYVYDLVTTQMNKNLFQTLQTADEQFRSVGNAIIDSLADCHE